MNISKPALTIIKTALFMVSCGVIWLHIRSRSEIAQNSLSLIAHLHRTQGFLFVFFTLILMCINWTAEAFKFKLCMRHIQQISLTKSLRAVLGGITVSFYTPNRSGEFAGRILHLDEGNRLKGAMAAFAGSTSQLLVTLQAGVFAFLFTAESVFKIHINILYIVIVLLIMSVLFFGWLNIPVVSSLLAKISFFKKYLWLTNVFGQYEKNELMVIYFISIIRFIIFCSQQYMLFRLFGTEISYSLCFALSSLSFLLITVIPSIAIGELGIRGSVNLALFGTAGADTSAILAVTFSLWFINLALPAIAGAAGFYYVKWISSIKR